MARLLLIDDDIAEISAVKRVLARSGRAPLLATNASDAQASITQNRPDLLLVGVGCENGEALAMAHRLEEDEATRGIPLILLGLSDQAPAHAVQLPRPIDPAVLGEQVRALLGDQQATASTMASTPIGRVAPRQVAVARSAAPVLPALEPLGSPPPEAPAPATVVPPTTDLFPAARMTSVAEPPRPEPFERRSASAPLPGALERRAVPSDPANARRAAAEALRARASELRRSPDSSPPPAPAEAAAGLDALFGIQPPDGEDAPPAPIAETPFDLPLESEPPIEPPLDEAAAEPAPAGDWFADAWPAGDPAATEVAVEVEPAAFDENALTSAARAAEEELARAREAEAEALRAREAELQAGQEREARAEEARQAEEEAARFRVAEARAGEEAEARRLLEEDLERLRGQLQEERRASETRLQSALERAAAEEAVALEQRAQAEAETRRAEAEARRAEEEARQAALRAAAEEATRSATAEAQARAAEELQQLRAQVELEAARRAEAEAALARAAETASQLAAERESLARAALSAPAPSPPAEPAPVGPSLGEPPPQDEAQEAARRRALSFRQRPAEVAAERAPFAWPEAPEPIGEAEPEPEPEPPPPAPPPAELRSGNLEDLPAPRLLALAARARMGGRLDVQGDAARSLWFEEGRVVGAASNAPGERVEEVALRLGLLTREQHRQVAGTAASLATRRAALLLLERGYVKPAELTALVRRRTDEVVFGVFGESGARFRWAPEAVPADERITPDRPPLALAVEGVRRRWLAPRTDAVLGGPATLVTPVHGAPTAAELGLSVEERRTLTLADGLRTLDELIAASPLDPLSARQLLAALVLTGALTVRVVQAGRPAAQVAAAIDLARVKEKHEQARRADYFTILGIGRVGTPHEAREAADRLLVEFDPRKLTGTGDEGLAARLEEIRRVVSDAREVLADDALRAEYLRGLGP